MSYSPFTFVEDGDLMHNRVLSPTFLLIAALLVLIATTRANAADENLITDGSFERTIAPNQFGHVFKNLWRSEKLRDEDLQALETLIMRNPSGPGIMKGTGGLRKIRFAPPSRGRG